MATLFISHSSKDRQAATEIAQRLKQRDYFSFFLDFDPEVGIPAGRNWERELYHRLLGCSAVLFLSSPHSASSKWCFAELTHARALDKKILPLKIADGELPGILKDVQAIDLREDAETAYQRLWAELERIGVSEEVGFFWDGTRPPYPGIFAFEEDDAAIFFGRNAEAKQFVDLLKRMRFTTTRLALVLGASGSGKSSLVRAGVLPRVRRSKADWIPLDPITAGPGLVEDLAEKMVTVYPAGKKRPDYDSVYSALDGAASRTESLEGSDLSKLLRRTRIKLGREDGHILWIIDQAERLLAGDHATNRAFQLIANCASSPGLPLQIVLTLRSDHLDAFQASAPMDGVPFESFVLGPLSSRRFGEVIEGPARLAGLRLEPGLVPALVVDASRRDGLPLLAFALRELWERFGRQHEQLTLEDYQQGIGGLEGCVGNRAKQVMAEHPLSDADQAQLRTTLSRMARLSEGDTFVGQPLAWASVPEQIRPVFQRLIDARLLVTGREKDIVEVAHEVLFEAWDDLKSWLQDELQFLRWQRSIQTPLREWERHGKNIEEVHLSGAQLREARDWLGTNGSAMSEAERAFVEDSQRRAQAEEERWHRSYQVSLARQLAAQAQVILSFEAAALTDRALLLAVEAMRRCTELGIPSLEADQALRQVLAISARRTFATRANPSVNFRAVGVHPNEPVVTFGMEDGQVSIWNIPANTIESGPRLEGSIQELAYSPDGRWLVVGSESGDCLLLDTTSGSIHRLEQPGSRHPTRAVAFAPDSSRVAVAFHNRILIWELSALENPVVLEHADSNNTIVDMTFSNDGMVLVTQPLLEPAVAWNWRLKAVVGRLGSSGNQVLHSPDGRFLGVTGPGGYEALIWDVYNQEGRQIANNSARLAFSQDGRYVGMASPEHFARIWSLPDFAVVHTLRHNAEVWNVTFSPDGTNLATAAKDNVARVWDKNTGEEVARMVHREYLWTVQFLSNSRHVLTHSGEGTLTLWDTQELRELRLFEHNVAVLGVAFDPNGRYLATHAREAWGKLAPVLIDPGSHQPVEVFQDENGQQVNGLQYAQELLKNHQESSRGKTYSPDRRFLAVAEGKDVKVFQNGEETADEGGSLGEPVCTLPHEHDVLRVVFSPDGRHLVTASDHDTARIWDVNLAVEVSRLTHENPNVVDVDFHPGGEMVATASWDHTARIWLWKPEDLMREAATRVSRNLSTEEWRKYLPAEPYRKTIPEIEEDS